MIGLEFDPLVPGNPKLKGEAVLTEILHIDVSYSKWWDLAAVAVIFISCRLLFFMILKFKERASPLVRALHTKRTLRHLSKRPSFRKIPSFPSQRQQNLRPLSSLEGLDSPIQWIYVHFQISAEGFIDLSDSEHMMVYLPRNGSFFII